MTARITQTPIHNTEFVILQGLEEGNRFFSTYDPKIDHTKLETPKSIPFRAIAEKLGDELRERERLRAMN
jgi:hypothetical protein